jgi:hypothetical protein
MFLTSCVGSQERMSESLKGSGKEFYYLEKEN